MRYSYCRVCPGWMPYSGIVDHEVAEHERRQVGRVGIDVRRRGRLRIDVRVDVQAVRVQVGAVVIAQVLGGIGIRRIGRQVVDDLDAQQVAHAACAAWARECVPNMLRSVHRGLCRWSDRTASSSGTTAPASRRARRSTDWMLSGSHEGFLRERRVRSSPPPPHADSTGGTADAGGDGDAKPQEVAAGLRCDRSQT